MVGHDEGGEHHEGEQAGAERRVATACRRSCPAPTNVVGVTVLQRIEERAVGSTRSAGRRRRAGRARTGRRRPRTTGCGPAGRAAGGTGSAGRRGSCGSPVVRPEPRSWLVVILARTGSAGDALELGVGDSLDRGDLLLGVGAAPGRCGSARRRRLLPYLGDQSSGDCAWPFSLTNLAASAAGPLLSLSALAARLCARRDVEAVRLREVQLVVGLVDPEPLDEGLGGVDVLALGADARAVGADRHRRSPEPSARGRAARRSRRRGPS